MEFVVPTIGFDLLYAYIIVRLDRRELVWISVTTHPSAEWVARQITEAFLWNEAPRYMIRDLDRIYGAVLTRRLRAMVPMALHAKACHRTGQADFPHPALGQDFTLSRATPSAASEQFWS